MSRDAGSSSKSALSSELVAVRRAELAPTEAAYLAVATRVIDTVLGVTLVVSRPVVGLAHRVVPLTAPVVRVIARPPLVPKSLQPASVLARVRGVGAAARNGATANLDRTVRAQATPLALAALDRIDVTDVVLEGVDLHAIVDAALDSMDLTETVLSRVDLDRIVTAALDGLDLTALVNERVDLAALADQVIDDVDLPEIIRESSTGIASDAIRGARMGAIAGDDLVAKWVDRIMLRRRARRTDAPGEPESPLEKPPAGVDE